MDIHLNFLELSLFLMTYSPWICLEDFWGFSFRPLGNEVETQNIRNGRTVNQIFHDFISDVKMLFSSFVGHFMTLHTCQWLFRIKLDKRMIKYTKQKMTGEEAIVACLK
jgi:hypothetical protein